MEVWELEKQKNGGDDNSSDGQPITSRPEVVDERGDGGKPHHVLYFTKKTISLRAPLFRAVPGCTAGAGGHSQRHPGRQCSAGECSPLTWTPARLR
jgi:hypothetical protein